MRFVMRRGNGWAGRWMLSAVALSLLVVLSVAHGAWLRDPFAGNWKVQVTAEGAGRGFNDTLTFRGGQMQAAELMKQGWESESFEEDVRRGGVAQFTAVIKHPSLGRMRWTGMVTASEIRGDVVWTTADGEERRFSYTGTKL